MQPELEAYFAGLVDGEGCFRVGMHGTGTIAIEVTNTHKPILHEMANFYDVGTVGVCGPQIYRYRVFGNRCYDLAGRLLPHLRIKPRQARLMREWYDLRANHPRRLEIEEELRALKGRKY